MSNKPQPSILIVDDIPDNLEILTDMLTYRGYAVRQAISGENALVAVEQSLPDLILLDVSMPGMNGYEVCAQLKADSRTAAIPVMFISALTSLQDKIQAFRMGGVDYISKPFNAEEVLARVQAQLTLYNQRREIERLLQQQRAYYENLNRLKDDLLNTASHDLKNPLGIIVGYAHLLDSTEAVRDPEFVSQSVVEIRKAAERMNALITDLLDLAKIETGMGIHPADTRLNPFLEQCAEDFRFQTREKHIDLAFVPGSEDTIVSFDSTRISQVIHNLLSNAIKYTPAGGTVKMTSEAAEHKVIIRVIDSGLGIPKDSLPNVFDKFFRVPDEQHAAIKGTGLGLAIAKAIVEQHHGAISVESEIGKGSTFSISLPLSATNGT